MVEHIEFSDRKDSNEAGTLNDIRSRVDYLKSAESPSFNVSLEADGFFKKTTKRVVRKVVMWILRPFELSMGNQIHAQCEIMSQIIDGVAAENEKNLATVQNQLEEIVARLKTQSVNFGAQITELETQSVNFGAQITELETQSVNFGAQITGLKAHLDSETQKLSAAARDVIRTKWKMQDYIDEQQSDNERILTCKICGYHAPKESFWAKETECIFDGGHLERYICPECGVVFGPTKFSDLSQKEIDDDYTVHYTGHHEGDSTEKELRAFSMLHPRKDRVYLDYGCGCWSDTLQQLRQEGYQVYGFEPYASDVDNPYMITDRYTVSQMRFDGIFSNDVLEHLIDPIAEMRFMKTLLKTQDACMSHSTGCYIYKNEYTRFHTFFFVGSSIDVVCDRVGLTVLQMIDDEKENDFICYVYGMIEEAVEYLPKMLTQGEAEIKENAIIIGKGAILCGPGIQLGAGGYTVLIELKMSETTEEATCQITAELGQMQLQQFTLHQGENLLHLQLEQAVDDVELVIRNEHESVMTFKRVALVSMLEKD